MRRDTVFRYMSIICIFLGLACCWIYGIMLYMFLSQGRFEDLSYTTEERQAIYTQAKMHMYEYTNQIEKISDQAWKDKIWKAFGNPCLLEIRIDFEHNGAAKPEYFHIVINENLTGLSYAYTLAHELTHATRWIGDEREAEFEMFKLMHGSNDEYLSYISWQVILRSCYSESSQYSCLGRVINHLKEIGQWTM